MYIRLFSYIQNEQLLLRDWLDHHGTIVPWWAIHIVDNNSTDDTTNILQEYKEEKGINVYTHDDYTLKGSYLTQLMIRYKAQESILIPIDGDEFIVLHKDNKIISTGSIIKDYINTLPLDGSMFKTTGCLNGLPESDHTDNPLKCITKFNWDLRGKNSKKFYYSKSFKSTDHGNHNGISTNKTYKPTDIAYLHYHNTGRVNFEKRCEADITGLGIRLEIIKQQIAERGQEAVKSMGNYTGHAKVNAYLNKNNWEYEPVSKFDIKFQLK